MASDLRFANYRRLLVALRGLAIPFVTTRDYMRNRQADGFCVVRHDVEWSCGPALEKARIEHELGIAATYYFHGPSRPRVFRGDAMRHIESLGHEVGYHYETLDQTNGDFEAARRLFKEALLKFRDLGITVDTVCSHGNPRKRKVGYAVNYDLFKRYPDLLAESALVGEAYLNLISPGQLVSASDTGARIKAARDGVPIALPNHAVADLISLVEAGADRRFLVLTHPDYWSESAARAHFMSLAGGAAHAATAILRQVRRILR